MKNRRQGKILELISIYDIGTQEMLMEKLRESGFDVTQATISRDIRELKLARVVTGKGSYKYVPPTTSESTASVKFNGALTESIISVESALNIVVIKTYPGLAQAVATGIDAVENSMIIGCIAGDDTIMVVTRDEKSATVVSQNIKRMIKTV